MVLKRCKDGLKKGAQLALAIALVYGVMPAPVKAADTAAPQAAAAAAAPAEPAEKGNADIGRQLFTGEKSFTNGAPPCISCHSAGVGALGGGVLGPNLTKVYADPSKNPLLSSGWINANQPTPMGPVFSNRPVTDNEVDNLRAFFQKQSMGPVAASSTGTFTIIGIAGFIGILIFFNIVWAGRYRNRNKGTAHDALWRNYGGKGGR
ncbi:MAG: hypothetical protein HZB21_06820 [Deltaproteobacteria bacterium]|nr:hypothetical protein [Deltaproteobacteria bacterium]